MAKKHYYKCGESAAVFEKQAKQIENTKKCR
jgi:hypothetical protein